MPLGRNHPKQYFAIPMYVARNRSALNYRRLWRQVQIRPGLRVHIDAERSGQEYAPSHFTEPIDRSIVA